MATSQLLATPTPFHHPAEKRADSWLSAQALIQVSLAP